MAFHTPFSAYYGDAAKTAPNDTPEIRACKLFCGSLTPATTPEMLTLYFSRYGTVEAASIKRDPNTGASRGFGFVRMETPQMVKDVLAANPHSLDGRVIDVKKVIIDDLTCKIFVGGLTFATTDEMLQKYFADYGNIVDASIRRGGDGKPRGFGFVLFSQIESVDAVLKSGPHFLDGKQIDPKRVYKEASEAVNSDTGLPMPKLFVGGLQLHTTKENLERYYSQYGTVNDCNIVVDFQTGKSRGFGFVRFADQDGLERAMMARPHLIDGRTVDTKRVFQSHGPGADKPENLISVRKVFVGGLKEEHTEAVLKDYFGQFGTVLGLKFPSRGVQAGRDHRGFAFIEFEDYDSVDRVILQPSHVIAGYDVDIRKGLTREEMERVEQLKRDRDFREGRAGGASRAAYEAGGGSEGGPQAGWRGVDAGEGGGYDGYGGPDPYEAVVAAYAGRLAEAYGINAPSNPAAGTTAAATSAYSYGYGSGRADLPNYVTGMEGIKMEAEATNGAYYNSPLTSGQIPAGMCAVKPDPDGAGAAGTGATAPSIMVLSGDRFKDLLLQSGVSADAVDGLQCENLLDSSVLSALTMREFEQLPISMGDRKRIEIALKAMRT